MTTMTTTRIPPSRHHHIHNLQDCISLQASMGYHAGKTTDTDAIACVESAADEHPCTITLCKRTKALEIYCPNGPDIQRFDGTHTRKRT